MSPVALRSKQTRKLQIEAAIQAKTCSSFVLLWNVRKHYPDKTASSETSTLSYWAQQAHFLFFIFYLWLGSLMQWLHALTYSKNEALKCLKVI